MRLADASQLVARVPPRVAGVAAEIVTPLLRLAARGRARAWTANLRAAGIPAPIRAGVTGGPDYHHLMMLYESIAMLGGRRFALRAEGVGRLDEALATGRGVLLVTAHVGNWHLGAQYVAARSGRPVHSIAGVQLAPGWTGPWRLALRRAGLRVHPRARSFARLSRILRAGGIVALHLDGDQHAMPGPATRGVATLARRTGATILPAVCHRERPGRLTVGFHPSLPGGNAAPGPALLERVLLDLVREHPEQWALFRPLWGSA
jgi:KDO2-lipid IV(A) lauroyltransferase